MLKELLVKNFQSHKDSLISFDSTITAIVGSSDAGKSSLIRALRWVTDGRPLGTGIVRKNSVGGCLVSLRTDNGEVVKLRDSHGTLYTVNGKDLDKVGSQVPSDVSSVLNVSPINYQFQLEPHFLVLESGGQIASFINSVLKLDVVNTAISICTKKINEKERERKELEETKREYQEDMDAYSPLEEIGALVEAYSKCVESSSGLDESITILEEIIAAFVEIEDKMRAFVDVEEIAASLDEIEEVLYKIDECEKVIVELGELISRIDGLEISLQKCRNVIQMYNKQLESNLISYEKELRNMGNCPWCGQQINEQVIRYKKNGLIT